MENKTELENFVGEETSTITCAHCKRTIHTSKPIVPKYPKMFCGDCFEAAKRYMASLRHVELNTRVD